MDAQNIITEIRAYSAAVGQKTTTVCQRVFKNPRYLERLAARLERLEEEGERFKRYAAENPPPPCAAQPPECPPAADDSRE